MKVEGSRMLVVSAHPGDLLWRCSGAVAKHVKLGGVVHAIILTNGIGGEANDLMKKGMTVEQAAAERKKSLRKAAEILGIEHMEFWDLPDYRFEITQDKTLRLAGYMRKFQPNLILTHHGKDILNPDHGIILDYVNMAMQVATGEGVAIEDTVPGLPRVAIFSFEPHNSEVNGFCPTIYIDITDVIDLKIAAMSTIPSKKKLADSYLERAKYRAVNARGFGNLECQYAEAYQALYPVAQDGYFVV